MAIQKISVVVSSGSYNTMQWTWWLLNNRHVLPAVVEAGNSRTYMPVDLGLGGGLGLRLVIFLSVGSHDEERKL